MGTGVYWANGIVLTNALNARISTFNMQMDKPEDYWTTTTAIQIAGSSKGVVISDGHMGRTQYGVAVSNPSERVRIENVETSENDIGYFINSTGGHNTISNCHAGGVPTAIAVVGSPDAVIIDNLLWPTATGIEVTSASRPQIRGNTVDAPLVGIALKGTMSNAVVVANQTNCKPGGTAILLESGVSDSLVVANDPRFLYPITDSGANNVKGINRP